jgi:hypothetical protein
MTIQRPAVAIRVASIVLLAVIAWGCAEEAVAPEPDLEVSFARPVASSSKPAEFIFPSAGYSVTNDGSALYSNGDCNVTAKTFIDDDGTEDANMQMSPPGKKAKCSRAILVSHASGEIDHVTGMNVNDVGTVTGVSLRSMNFTISSPTKCSRIGFGNLVGGELVTVTRGADVGTKRTWNVSFDGLGACVTPQGATVSVALTVNFDVTDK